MKNETIFEVQVNGRNEFVKAYDQGHADRIAQQMTNRELASAESFRDMMPTSEEFYADFNNDRKDCWSHVNLT